ncbi:TPA: hypothetical protein N0F65_002143 [Lagenidium giganteum]|uniref:Uncharacterized protein n=1 Tax=Lagenidium giganteum TaxID=4803 RepID=A0AAV2ZDL9_9STRA|nr:TPA: hypothetical protein N0F65_002143 [Lagenidium giganteum]
MATGSGITGWIASLIFPNWRKRQLAKSDDVRSRIDLTPLKPEWMAAGHHALPQFFVDEIETVATTTCNKDRKAAIRRVFEELCKSLRNILRLTTLCGAPRPETLSVRCTTEFWRGSEACMMVWKLSSMSLLGHVKPRTVILILVGINSTDVSAVTFGDDSWQPQKKIFVVRTFQRRVGWCSLNWKDRTIALASEDGIVAIMMFDESFRNLDKIREF